MLFLQIEIGHLITGELRAQHSSRVLPLFSVRREDARPKQRPEGPAAKLAKVEVVELRGKDGLHVLWIGGHDAFDAQITVGMCLVVHLGIPVQDHICKPLGFVGS